jgi:tetratricopeptide (TPR) repeat protein
MGQSDKAQQVYEVLLEQTSSDREKANIYHQLGLAKDDQGEYKEAITFYEKALEIKQKTLPPNHPHLAGSYNNIGVVYYNMGDYPKALSYYEKALEIEQKLFLQITQIWLLLTPAMVPYMKRWAITRKHYRIMKKHWKSIKKLFLQITQIWLLLTTTSVRCITRWTITRKHFPLMKKH